MLVEKILIANRGEIACRIIRTVKSMGFTAVALFSDADRDALHVQIADEAVYIGASEANQSYLNINTIIQAAKKIQADAIHPGYGFLSENSEFAARCLKEKLIFIGPSPEAIKLMGSKSLSKEAMKNSSVACIPGYQGEDQSDERLIKEAETIGFPVMIKAAAGGGGRGMRKVTESHSLLNAIHSARSEALSGFGNAELILEKAIEHGRHIEIQILADTFGHCIHLGERDCSLQRRHQKVIEESPSPLNRAALREKMGSAAIKAAESCHYSGAGTVEFLVDDDLNFYFLEMNTRIQVEHPVTELVTGIDIVEQQIRIAIGEPLQLKQHEVQFSGHAIEARLYAEDPSQNYLPQTGQIQLWNPPSGEGIRVDTGISNGQSISPYYDSMIAKIVGFGKNRYEAIRRLTNALKNTHLCGVKTNRDFLIELLETDYVREGQFDTSTLQSPQLISDLVEPHYEYEILAIASIVKFSKNEEFSSLSQNESHLFTLNQLKYKVEVFHVATSDFKVVITDQVSLKIVYSGLLKLWSQSNDQAQISFENIRMNYFYSIDEEQIWVSNREFTGSVQISQLDLNQSNTDDGLLKAPMDGKIINLMTYIGDEIKKGQTLAIVDAMKIEHPISAPYDAVVSHIHIKPLQQVKNKQILITLKEIE